MTPIIENEKEYRNMKKTIMVIDDLGNKRTETYERRAKGLVKKGRATYVDAHTICLTTHTKENQVETLSIQDILTRLDQVTNDKTHIKDAMLLMERIPNDIDALAVQARSEAIADIVKEREETNRKIVELLEKMYDNI